MKVSIVASLAMTLLFWTSHLDKASAQDDPCQTDATRLCQDAVPDEDKIAACLKANHAKLTPKCKRSFDERMKSKT